MIEASRKSSRGAFAALLLGGLILSVCGVAAAATDTLLLTCRLRTQHGSAHLCQTQPNFCEQSFVLDQRRRTVAEISGASGRTTPQNVVEWSRDSIRFEARSAWTDDVVVFTVTVIDRRTGTLSRFPQHRHPDGTPISDQERSAIERRSLHPMMSQAMQVYADAGTCSVGQRLF